jgi:hypothetical protein
MSLYATHLRFALDLAEQYEAQDLNKYLAGVVYPDSRYVTNIDRNLTHPEVLDLESFAHGDDFRKGWHAHLICDKKFHEMVDEKYPSLHQYVWTYGNPGWIGLTALKVLQDIQDVQKFDIQKHLSCFDYIETPHGEDTELLAEHHKIWKEMYEKHNLSIDHVTGSLVKLGMSEEIGSKINTQAYQYTKDPKAQEFLKTIYNEMLKKARK